MFGFVVASLGELEKTQRTRYNAVYCGICRCIRARHGQLARLGLSYDMAFLGLLLLSLYEPEETGGKRACGLHPLRPRPWVGASVLEYCADMNTALGYHKLVDDWQDEGSRSARTMARQLQKHLPAIREKYPRQVAAMEESLGALRALEAENCPNPDLPAQCFGKLMGELTVWQEDRWAEELRRLGQNLGRFIYLADAAVDYKKDRRSGSYNPFAAMGTGEDPARWEEYLVLALARCTEYYERLPLVQDKEILDNILYSGIWTQVRRQLKK